jgi:vacuolar-type H+-ATPase subunit H
MVDETLKRLLEAEAMAEQAITHAEKERQTIIGQATQEARAAEQHHAGRIMGIHAAFLAQAEQQAQQTIAELQQRYSEQSLALRASSGQLERQALDEALGLLTGLGKP